MGSKRYDIIQTQGLQRVRIGGSFQPSGTSAPTNVIGQGWSVARTGVGAYLITFTDTFFALDEAQVSVRSVGAAFAVGTFGEWVPASKTLVLKVYNIVAGAAAPVDLGLNADDVINFHVLFRNTVVNY
jgi:hypothetical protein